ncbi:LIM and SH3 domain protein 1-like isoform X2 [Symsagittifera roscoffensis]|uniref:LIM and SH3 domain protein 1-like isoform X2 n=1 Tax=Symsagittifera roscoffensis TaxID=84072 RepID=UPI00307C9B76
MLMYNNNSKDPRFATMDYPCVRCEKSIPASEILSCLDKCWHKACFFCETCKIVLTLETYKGYNKLPYCDLHYPSVRHTTVAEAPANLNGGSQNQAVYYNKHQNCSCYSVVERGDLTGAPVVPKEGGDNPPSASRDGNVVRTSNNAPEYVESGASYRAIYDYTAADDDEISFKQGDVIKNGTIVDDGWMTGCNEKTGKLACCLLIM